MKGKAEISKKHRPEIIHKCLVSFIIFTRRLFTNLLFVANFALVDAHCTAHPFPPCPRSDANVVKSRSASQYLLWVAPFPFPISFFFSFWFKVNVSRTTSPLDVDSPFPICFLVVNFLCLIYIFFGVLSQGQRDNISNGCRAIWTNSI